MTESAQGHSIHRAPPAAKIQASSAPSSRDLAEYVSDIIVRADTSGVLCYVSPGCRALGYEPAELVGRSAVELVHPDDWERFAANTSQLMSGEAPDRVANREFRYRRKDGAWSWLEGNPQVVRDSEGRPFEIVNVFRDVSERRRLSALAAEHARFENLAKAVTGVGYWWLDVESGQISWSDQMFLVYGLSPGTEPPLTRAMEMVHPEDRQQSDERLRLALETGVGWDEAVCRLVQPDGEVRYVEGRGICERDESGALKTIFGTMVDITDRKRAELAAFEADAERRANVELFENAFHHAAIGMALVGTDGRFLKINAAFCDLVGYSEQDMLALDFQTITHPDDLEVDLDLVGKLAAGDFPSYQMEKRYLRSDGAIVWVNLSVSMVLQANGEPKHFIAQVQDLTEREAARRKLEDSEARFRELADSATDIVLKVDTADIIEYVSPSVRRYGYEPDDLIGRRGSEFIHPDDLPKVLARLVTLGANAEARQNLDSAYRMVTADGGHIWTEANSATLHDKTGAPTGIICHMRDITERRAAVAALAESELRHRVIAENATDLITRTGIDGRIRYVSPSSLDVTGFRPDELIGRNMISFMHPEDREANLAIFRQIITGDRSGNLPLSYRTRHKAGHWFWMECNPTLVRDAEGAPVEFIDVCRDVSARVRLEAELRAARDAAEEATAVKSAFLANMSHEIRTPLTAILGFTRLLADGPNLDETARSQVERVSGAGEALLSIVNDVLDFSKLEAGQFEISPRPVAVAEVLRETLLMFTPQAQDKGLTLTFDAPANLPVWVNTDPNRLRQILINLVGNAVKFTESGGIRVVARYQAASQQLRVRVEDTGPGMTKAQQERLFQRFSQVDASTTRRHGGTGLGLAICKGLVEAMGGDIGADSEPGAGSVFHFRIVAPLAVAPVALDAACDTAAIDGLRVLVADDNETNRKLTQAVLETLGVEVTLAIDGLDAVQASKTTPFDVILMDIRMPNLDGPAAVSCIRNEPGPNQDVPILAFSADADMSRFEDSASDFDGIVRKPLVAVDLIAALTKSLSWDDAPPTQEEVVHVDAL